MVTVRIEPRIRIEPRESYLRAMGTLVGNRSDALRDSEEERFIQNVGRREFACQLGKAHAAPKAVQ